MSAVVSRLLDLLALSVVSRWVIVPRLKEQSVADHTFRVVVIARELADSLGVVLDADDYWYLITHDGAESRSGDISSPFKAQLPNLSAIENTACPWMTEVTWPHSHKLALFKTADLVEALTFIRAWGRTTHAEAIGNKIYNEIHVHCRRYDIDVFKVDEVISQIERNERWR